MNLPQEFDKSHSKAYFDCKRRTLVIILPLYGYLVDDDLEQELVTDETQNTNQETEVDETQNKSSVTIPLENLASDDMMFDLV